jgi:hypothetical protein
MKSASLESFLRSVFFVFFFPNTGRFDWIVNMGIRAPGIQNKRNSWRIRTIANSPALQDQTGESESLERTHPTTDSLERGVISEICQFLPKMTD